MRRAHWQLNEAAAAPHPVPGLSLPLWKMFHPTPPGSAVASSPAVEHRRISSSGWLCSAPRSPSSPASLGTASARGNRPSSLTPGELCHTFFPSHFILLLAAGLPNSSYEIIQSSIINTGLVLHRRHEGKWANLRFEMCAGNTPTKRSSYTVLFTQVLMLFIILAVHPSFTNKSLWVTVLNSSVEVRLTNLCYWLE